MAGETLRLEEPLARRDVARRLDIESRRVPRPHSAGQHLQLSIHQRKCRHPAARAVADHVANLGFRAPAQGTRIDQSRPAVGTGRSFAVASRAILAIGLRHFLSPSEYGEGEHKITRTHGRFTSYHGMPS